jgi:hypothetical protein
MQCAPCQQGNPSGKHVTVLFADLKGSMELLADRDPEDARKILATKSPSTTPRTALRLGVAPRVEIPDQAKAYPNMGGPHGLNISGRITITLPIVLADAARGSGSASPA